MQKINNLAIVSVFFIIASIILVASYGLYELYLSSVFWGGTLLLINNIFFPEKKLKSFSLFSYSYANCIGILLICLHIDQISSTFDMFGDDERFYNWAIASKDNFFSNSYSSYEKILAIVLLIFQTITFGEIKDSPLLLLPLNWMLFALTATLSLKLTKIITQKYIPYRFITLCLLLNYTLVQNSVHLYRDIWISFFTILGLILILREKNHFAYLSAFLNASIRLPNGVLSVLMITISRFLKTKTLLSGMSSILLLFIFVTLFFSSNINIGKYSSSNIFSYTTERQEYYNERISDQSGGVSFVSNLPILFQAVAHIPGQILRPIGIDSFYKPQHHRFEDIRLFNHRSFGNAITTVTLIFLAGYYLQGLIVAFLSKDYKIRVFLILLLMLLLTSGFLSIEDRNRVMFIPLLPVLISLALKHQKLSKSIIFKPITRKISAILILALVIGVSI